MKSDLEREVKELREEVKELRQQPYKRKIGCFGRFGYGMFYGFCFSGFWILAIKFDWITVIFDGWVPSEKEITIGFGAMFILGLFCGFLWGHRHRKEKSIESGNVIHLQVSKGEKPEQAIRPPRKIKKPWIVMIIILNIIGIIYYILRLIAS